MSAITLIERIKAYEEALSAENSLMATKIQEGSDAAVRLWNLCIEFPGSYDMPDVDRYALVQVSADDQSDYWVNTYERSNQASQVALDDVNARTWFPLYGIDLITGQRSVVRFWETPRWFAA